MRAEFTKYSKLTLELFCKLIQYCHLQTDHKYFPKFLWSLAHVLVFHSEIFTLLKLLWSTNSPCFYQKISFSLQRKEKLFNENFLNSIYRSVLETKFHLLLPCLLPLIIQNCYFHLSKDNFSTIFWGFVLYPKLDFIYPFYLLSNFHSFGFNKKFSKLFHEVSDQVFCLFFPVILSAFCLLI